MQANQVPGAPKRHVALALLLQTEATQSSASCLKILKIVLNTIETDSVKTRRSGMDMAIDRVPLCRNERGRGQVADN